MTDAHIRDLARRAEAGDRDALRELAGARARLGQFTCCGRPRPPGSCGLCWHCREPGEVLVGEAYLRKKLHVAELRTFVAWDNETNQHYVESEDSVARCDGRIRGPGPARWGTPTCERCLYITGLVTTGLPERVGWKPDADRYAWGQIVAFTRRAPTILHDGTPILVPGVHCPDCGEPVELDVVEWETDAGIPGELHLTCTDERCDDGGWVAAHAWGDVTEEALRWAQAHVRVLRG